MLSLFAKMPRAPGALRSGCGGYHLPAGRGPEFGNKGEDPMRKAVFVILDHYADWEPAFLAMALKGEVGEAFEVSYASTDRQPKTSIGGLTALPDLSLSEVKQDADALIFIGADGSWRQPQEEAAALAHRFHREGKVVAAICDAARWLGSVGLLNDVAHTLNDPGEMEAHPVYANPAGYREAESVLDGRVVTANGNAPVAFAADVLRALRAAPEEDIRQFLDFYTMGFHAALRKFGFK